MGDIILKQIKLYFYLFLYDDYDKVCEYGGEILEEENIEKYAMDTRYELRDEVLKHLNEDIQLIYDFIEDECDVVLKRLMEEIKNTIKICNDERDMYITFQLDEKDIDKKMFQLETELTDGIFSSDNDFDFNGKYYIALWKNSE